MKKTIILIMIFLFIVANIIPESRGNNTNVKYHQSSLEVAKIFGVFPQAIGDIIIYLSISPIGWTTIYKDYFKGYLGLTIRGTYNTSILPQAQFVYFPSQDILRVEGNPITFRSVSTDLDGEIIEEWWKFNDSGPWVMIDTPQYIFTESGYYNVSLRVIDNDQLNHTYTKHIRIYDRTPTLQGIQESNYVTIVGYHVVGSIGNYNWSDFKNVGSGSCEIPTNGHPNIDDVITNCTGLIIIQYVPNGVVSGSWYF